MNEHTERLLNTLADKLGTTAEHLWGVLVKQAPIEACSTLAGFMILTFVAVAAFAWGFRKKLTDDFTELEKFGALFVSGAFMLTGCVLVVCALPDVITAFVNPEYWALRQVLQQVRN